MDSRDIRQWREHRHLSRSTIARRLGVPDATVWRWETGRRMPSAATLQALAAALRVPADAIRLPPRHGDAGEAVADD